MEKLGILFFVPTDHLAGSDEPSPPAGTKDLKFMGYASDLLETVSLQNVSDLSAELCDQHLDVGKTMGIRQAILDIIEVQKSGFQVHFVDPPNNESGGDGFGAWTGHTTQQPGDEDYDTVLALYNSLNPPFSPSASTSHKEYTHAQFLLVNMNYKSPVAQTPAGKIKWTFGSKAARESAGVYLVADIGKVALQTDEKSWWVLDRIEPIADSNSVTPIWRSQDLQSQIAAGCLTNRVTLFFLPNGDDDPFYAFISQYHDFHGPGSPLRDLKDQRALYDIEGDGAETGWLALAHQFNNPAANDPQFVATNFKQNWRLGPYLGSLGIFASFAALMTAAASFVASDIGREATYYDADLPYTVTLLSITPIDFTSANNYPITVLATPFTDTSFVYHLLPDGAPPLDYGGIGNPDLTGIFRQRQAAITGRVLVTQFKITDP